MAIELKDIPSTLKPEEAPAAPKKRSIIGRTWRGVVWLARWPAESVGASEIGRHAGMIGSLFRTLKAGPGKDRRLHLEEGREIDLRATAFSCGLSVPELEARLARRRRQTAQSAYAAFALGCLAILAWLWRAMVTPWTSWGVLSSIEFLPFCGIFFLMAFYCALQNFQLRTGRMANWREYLGTEKGFWPS